MIRSMVVSFCFIGGLCYSHLITLAQFQGSAISPGIFQDFMDGYVKP